MKLVTNGFAPLYANVLTKTKIQDCNEGTVFVFDGQALPPINTEYLWITRDMGNNKTLSGDRKSVV